MNHTDSDLASRTPLVMLILLIALLLIYGNLVAQGQTPAVVTTEAPAAEVTAFEATALPAETVATSTSDVYLSVTELTRIVAVLQAAKAARQAPPAQALTTTSPAARAPAVPASQSNVASLTTPPGGADDRLSRTERLLEQLLTLELARAQGQSTAYAPGGSTAASGSLDDQREIARLRDELNRSIASATAEERRYQDHLAAERSRNDQRPAYASPSPNAADAVALEALRNDLRRMERELVVANAAAAAPLAGSTSVDSTGTAPVDTTVLLRLERQREQLAQLRDELAEQERRFRSASPDTVYVTRTVTAPAPAPRALVISNAVPATQPEPLGAILFAVGSAGLNDRTAAPISAALDGYRRGAREVVVRGFASPDGSAAANRVLTQKRASAVRDALILRGVPSSMIRILPGEIDADASAAVARRVELQLSF